MRGGAGRRACRAAGRQHREERRRATTSSGCSSARRARSASSPRRRSGCGRSRRRPPRWSARSTTWSRPGARSRRSMAELRPSALELMDAASVAAVEAVRPMGLESVGALLLGQSDAGGGEAERMAKLFEAAGATYVAVTDDPDEGELLMGARRMAIPCVERLGAVLIEDVGVPVPRIPELVAAVERIAARAPHARAGDRSRRRRQLPSAGDLRPRRRRRRRARRPHLPRHHARRARARRHGHRRARHRHAEGHATSPPNSATT